jgi:PAS domain S-box-containing protein
MAVSAFSNKNIVASGDLISAISQFPITIIDTGADQCVRQRGKLGVEGPVPALFDRCQTHFGRTELANLGNFQDLLCVPRDDVLFDFFVEKFPWLQPLYLIAVRHDSPSNTVVAWICLISDADIALSLEQKSAIKNCVSLLSATSTNITRAHFLNTPKMFCVCDLQGGIREVNQLFAETLGYHAKELVGRRCYEFIHPDDLAVSYQKIEKMSAGRSVKKFRNRYQHKDGSYRLLQWSAASVVEDQLIYASAADVTEQAEAEVAVAESNKMLSVVSQALAEYIRSEASINPFDVMLSHLLRISGSEYGFIGEVLKNADGEPYLQSHALTNIAWDETTRRLYDENVATGLKFTNLKTLFGHVMTTGRPVISNLPAKDPRSGGLPAGHPALHAFMGLPIYSGLELVGMVGIANRPGGYDERVARNLELLLSTCSNLILAFRAERGRQLAQQ